ncbi:MAG: hypothetical protein EXR73_04100 [Myxococcales bacterium]|nr:hypothetical protein [Myxococcales bacterium]
MSWRRLALVSAALVILVAVLLVGRTRTERDPSAASIIASTVTERGPGAAAPVRRSGGDSEQARGRDGGRVVVRGAWGAGQGDFGRRSGEEQNAEGPMAIASGPGGEVIVLDQVNARAVRFGPDGAVRGSVALGPDTAQDLAMSEDGRIAVLDRVGAGQVLLHGPDGVLAGQVPVAGGPIAEAGGATGVFIDAHGVWVEREHGELVRVAGTDGTADPDRPTQPGRPTRDGLAFVHASLPSRTDGIAQLRLFDRDGQLLWQRSVAFGRPIVQLLLLDSDRAGRVYLGAHLGRESSEPPFMLVDQAIVIARYVAEGGVETGRLALPATDAPEEVLRPLAVTDEGAILQLVPGDAGVEIVRYEFP